MKHDLDKLRRRLADECRGIAAELQGLPDDAAGAELHKAELVLRDCIANARLARNLIERAKAQTSRKASA